MICSSQSLSINIKNSERYSNSDSGCTTTSLKERFLSAVKTKDIELVNDLLVKCENLPIDPEYLWDALVCACFDGCFELVRLFVDDVDVNICRKDVTPILSLCQSNNKDEDELLKCMDLLLSKGGRIDQCDKHGTCALSVAVSNNHEKLIIKLINEGADINHPDNDGWTPLFYAVVSGNLFLISLLKDYHADILVKDKRGQTLVDVALEMENLEVIELLNGSLVLEKWFDRFEKPSGHLLNVLDVIASELPRKEDRLSGFKMDVYNILNSVNLRHLNNEFTESNYGIGHLLTANDDGLKNIGVHFYFERHKILNAVKKFHEHPWSTSSFKNFVNHSDFYFEVAQLMATVTRQIHLISISTYWWATLGGIDPEISTLSSTLKESLTTVKALKYHLKSLGTHCKVISKEHSNTPSDLILPQNKENWFKSKILLFATACLCGLFIFKTSFNLQ